MSTLFESARKLWERAQWRMPPALERTLLPYLYELEELVVPFIKPDLDVWQWQGQGTGSPLTVTYIGLEYFSWYLKEVMFTEEPQEIVKEPVSFWRPNEVACAPGSDIVVVAGSERLIRRLPRQNAIVVPLYVQNRLPIQGEWDHLRDRLRKSKSVRNEFSWLGRYDYVCEASRNYEDLEMHYHKMYLPTMAARHGDVAHIVSEDEARQHFRHGHLLFAKRDGEVVASGLCRAHGDTLRWVTIGVLDGDEQLLQERVIGAMYILVIRWANQTGYKYVDFLGCPPFLSMGVFRYKRKWGTRIGIPPDSHKQVWFKFQRDTPAVRHFLKENPCAVIDEQGDLRGLVVIDDPDAITPELEARWDKDYLTPGMKSLLIRSFAQLLP